MGTSSSTIVTTGTTSEFLAPVYPTVYIGRKPLDTYIDAVERELKKNASMGVWIQARGDLISRAILVALRVVREYKPSNPLGLGNFYGLLLQPTIGSERLKGRDNKEREVPFITILLYSQPTNWPTVTITPNPLPLEPWVPTYPVNDPFRGTYTGDPMPPQPITVN